MATQRPVGTNGGNGNHRRVTPMQKVALATYAWLDERFRIRNVAHHLGNFYMQINMQLPRSHTEKYKLRSIWYWYPMYTLGSISALSFLLAAITGILLTLWYVPSTAPLASYDGQYGEFRVEPTEAWISVAYIMTDVPFGFMIRALHFWSAMIMVAAVFLHMMRVYFTQAYKKPRELNWLIGVGLFAVTIFLGYTGYILPWSQLSYWASTIGNEMAAATPPPALGRIVASFMFGNQFGTQQTLTRMYVLHVLLLPLAAVALIGLHIVIVWIQGIAEPH
ncbi:MAG TPA: cytochrome b N-terminal domain-containing protein [Candidatus Thermoplasmatota archaeon]|nr:cytochrome b N-terminal domain-containing protein [Candidatus Thermoplasmatota archaeon]